jgi:tRNA G18 (ribose-2'-O)-methylase SpoU
VGTHHYTDVRHIRQGDYDSVVALREIYPHFVAADIIEDVSTDLRQHVWQPGTLIFFGEEGCGLPLDVLGMCDTIVHIPQMGSVRSINVGTSSGIFMHDYMMRLQK